MEINVTKPNPAYRQYKKACEAKGETPVSFKVWLNTQHNLKNFDGDRLKADSLVDAGEVKIDDEKVKESIQNQSAPSAGGEKTFLWMPAKYGIPVAIVGTLAVIYGISKAVKWYKARNAS